MSRGGLAAGLFALFFSLYALTSSGNPFRVPDEFEVYFQAEHLVDAGDLSVPQTLAITQGGQPIFFGRFGLDGRPYAPYGPGVAFLLLPFHLAGRAVARLAAIEREPLPGGIVWELVVGGVTTFASAFAAALAVAGFFRACVALGADNRRAIALALALGGATVLWPFGRTLYSASWLAACFAWAAALLIEARASSRGVSRVALAAALIAVAGITKPTALVIAPGLVVAVLASERIAWRTRMNVVAALCVAAAAATGVHLWWNFARFGRALEFGYNLGEMIPEPPVRPFIPGQVPWGLFVLLFTPGKSIFAWAPVLLVSMLVLRDAFARDRGLVAGALVSLASALVFYAAFFLPEGGYAHGPRHLVPLVPLLMLPLALPAIAIPRRGFVAASLAGALVAALAVSVSFLEDQSPVQGPRFASPYYDRIDPGPGEPALRYRVDYVPFKHALTSGRWLAANRPVGEGPDFFALHLARARDIAPGGRSIPAWLPYLLSLGWLPVFVAAAYALAREWKSTMNRSNA